MSTNSEITNDSTGSSLISAVQQLKAAEDILQEHGSPEDYTNRLCTCLLNQYAMVWKTTPPSQAAIYRELIENSKHKNDLDTSRLTLISSPHGEEEAGGSGGTKHVQEEDKKTSQDKFNEADIGPVSESLVDFDNKIDDKAEKRSNT